MIKRVFLLTKRFPYDPPMEAPLSEELTFWSKEFPGQVYLIPKRDKEHGLWEIPKNIKIAELPKDWKQAGKAIRILETLFSKIFISECFYLLFKRKEIKLNSYKRVFSTTYEVFIYKRKLAALIDSFNEEPILIYSYWFNQISYSAALLKRKRPHLKVIARAVSRDLYEYRNTDNYLPLKRQFRTKLDQIYTISREGLEYATNQFNIPNEKLTISRKGIQFPAFFNKPSEDGHLVLLSIAVFKPLKRIDKIIEAIALFAAQNPEIKITWHHLGGVVLERMHKEERKLRSLAEKKFAGKRIEHQFHGTLPHSEIIKFLQNNTIDVIVNASETEGVPLSIMEAMAHGIPAIAPEVGGVSELVTSEHGILMSKNPDINEIKKAFMNSSFYKDKNIREKARYHIFKHYNIANNYPQFIQEITES